MTISMSTVAPSAVLDLIATMEDAVDELNSSELCRLDDTELRTLLHGVERVSRKSAEASRRTISECNERGTYRRWGYKRLAQMVVGELKLSAGEAARRLRVAAATVPQRSMAGEVRDPARPDVADAVADGSLSEHQADKVLDTLDKIPSGVSEEQRAKAESVLTEASKDLTPRQVEQAGDRLLAHLDPDGSLTSDADRAKRRGVSLSPQDAAMMSKLKGELDPATRAMFDVLFDAWAKPGMNNPDDPESPSGSYTDPGTDRDAADAAAERDTRTAPQRRHDALKAMAAWFMAQGTLGSNRGSPAQVVVTMAYEQILAMAGVAKTMSGGLVPVVDALQMATANSMVLAILDAQELPLYVGRTKRLATFAQRIALWLKHRGCTYPGCDRSASWTQAHHVIDWAKGGLTDLDQLAPVCTDHHPMVGDGPEHWQTIILTDGPYKGRCAWIPPASIDPERKPRVNHVHHPEEVIAHAWERLSSGDRRHGNDPWIT